MLSHFTHHPHPQAVDIHKEKVARREIGALASSKNITRAQKVVVPAQKERPQKFFRQRLDFTCLDGIGHGTKVADSTTRIDERYSGKEVSELICQVLVKPSNSGIHYYSQVHIPMTNSYCVQIVCMCMYTVFSDVYCKYTNNSRRRIDTAWF